MSADEFWNQDCELVKAYRKSDAIRQERLDVEAWLQGKYIYDALVAVAPIFRDFVKGAKVGKYVEKPYIELAREKKERETRERMKQNGLNYMQQFAHLYNKQRADRAKRGEKRDS